MKKVEVLQEALRGKKLDVCFIDNPQSVALLTGFQSEPHERILAAILTRTGKRYLFTPALEHTAALQAAPEWTTFSYTDEENPWQIIAERLRADRIPADYWAIEKEHLTVTRLEKLQSQFPDAQFHFDLSPVLAELALFKDDEELEKMRQAGYLADEALKIGARALREGITEVEVAAQIEYEMKRRGIREMSFDTMVLFGPNAALPHGVPGNTPLAKNQFVLFDLGVMHGGYASDVTRTLFFGDELSPHQSEVYELVLKAHDQAMAAARSGIVASDLDAAARAVITKGGYGEAFNHRLGHGLGRSVHEYPSIVAGNEMVLQEHMCFSIEPGIYLEGNLGVRIEDCGYVTGEGFHPFTHFPTHIHAYQDIIKQEV